MQRRHRRTKSATLYVSNPPNLQQNLLQMQVGNSILLLLNRCQEIAREKVHKIQDITFTIQPHQQNTDFKFGKGTMKHNIPGDTQPNRYTQNLVSIPQNVTTASGVVDQDLHNQSLIKQRLGLDSQVAKLDRKFTSTLPLKEISNKKQCPKQGIADASGYQKAAEDAWDQNQVLPNWNLKD